ncbi:iron ABC transporter permease [Eubacteriales bacterium OttesenSCG-928-A19]|nr:iron ABC transporter permease [Eubacteriales bacterium OttesenSCG-928-A19]
MQRDGFRGVRRRRRLRYQAVFIGLLAAFAVITVANINAGSVPIPIARIARILLGNAEDATQYAIIWKIRMPRILTAAILGGALALAGFLLQTFFGNPIAGPYVLGISSGAKMMVALTMIYLLDRFRAASSWALIGAAFVGAMIATGFILLLSQRIRQMSVLLVAGIMIGYICSAITDFMVTFARDADIINLHGWSQGSFSGMSWANVRIALVVVGVAGLLVFLLSKPMGAYQMGEAHALSVGVNIRLFRAALIVLSSVLSACVAAFAGPISFVGIAVPQLIKLSLGTSRPVVVIPAVFLGGAVFCMLCDLIARTAFAPMELSISTVTSILGAPVVIWMLVGRQRRAAA